MIDPPTKLPEIARGTNMAKLRAASNSVEPTEILQCGGSSLANVRGQSQKPFSCVTHSTLLAVKHTEREGQSLSKLHESGRATPLSMVLSPTVGVRDGTELGDIEGFGTGAEVMTAAAVVGYRVKEGPTVIGRAVGARVEGKSLEYVSPFQTHP